MECGAVQPDPVYSHRRFALPDSADPERITASGRNGVLQIVIPKKPETTPRKIQVGTVHDA